MIIAKIMILKKKVKKKKRRKKKIFIRFEIKLAHLICAKKRKGIYLLRVKRRRKKCDEWKCNMKDLRTNSTNGSVMMIKTPILYLELKKCPIVQVSKFITVMDEEQMNFYC